MNTDEVKYPFFNKTGAKFPFLPTISYFIRQPFIFKPLPALRTSTPLFSQFFPFPPFPLSFPLFPFPLFSKTLPVTLFSRSTARLIPTATDVLLFLTPRYYFLSAKMDR